MFCRGIITGDRNFIVFGPFKTIFDIFGHVAGEKIYIYIFFSKIL